MPPTATTRSVSSSQNARVKLLRRALSHGELVEGLCGVDSPHLLHASVKAGLRVPTLFLCESSADYPTFGEEERIVLPEALFRQVVSVEQGQGVAGLVAAPQWEADAVLREQRGVVLVAAGLQDPGNLGTVIRSAEAFGANAVIRLKGTVSQWNAKAARGSAGSVFRLPVLDLDDVGELGVYGFRLLVADSHRGEIAPACDLRVKTAIIIGNEGSGVPSRIEQHADGFLRIPHLEAVESLNAGIAASLLLYEAFRQRHYRDC